MRNEEEDVQNKTLFCGNLSDQVTDEILFELFNQAGPVESVRRPKDQTGHPKSFGFVVFKHECSVPYAVELFKGTKLFNRNINVNTRNNYLCHVPVLDTHLTEYTVSEGSRREPERTKYRDEFRRNDLSHRREDISQHQYSKDKRDEIKASSWSELKNDPVRSRRYMSNGFDQGPNYSERKDHSRDNGTHTVMPDFNLLMQLGQQMMVHGGMMGHPGMSPMAPHMSLGPSLGNNMFPSMQGRMSGGSRYSPPRERGYYESREREPCDYNQSRERRDERGNRREHYEERESRRNHPYRDGQRSNWEEHKRHDRGYSSSRSSHDRERRDRRSR